jgi:soluble lytic murein transglycosylase
MQVMPETGRMTARNIGINKFQPDDLLKADKNVPIGSAYLRQMYDLFNGNAVLATAAYNAGPHRVKTWLPKSGCMEPDIWIEKIPFTETWKYVRRVLFYASIYDWRLERDIVPIQRRMAVIESPRKTLLAGLSCQPQEVSYN